jgi:hypothetical protein
MECSALSAGDHPSVRPEFFGGDVILGRTMTRQPRLVPVVAFDLTLPFSALKTSASANSVRRVVRPLCCRDLADERSSGLHDNRRGANRATRRKKADNYFSAIL